MGTPGLGLEITELRLGLPCMGGKIKAAEKKRAFWEIDGEEDGSSSTTTTEEKTQKVESGGKGSGNQVVVGWPPVCSYRRKNSFNGREKSAKTYVKVSMDGAPILRKIDLGPFAEYSELTGALQKLFHSFDHSEAGNHLYFVIYSCNMRCNKTDRLKSTDQYGRRFLSSACLHARTLTETV